MSILIAENLTKKYSDTTALDNVSINVPTGSVYGLLGPNGAGKTTLIRIINQITMPDSGTVTFNGHRLTQKDVEHIGYMPEERGLYKKMKVGEQAIFLARLKGLSRYDATERLRSWFRKFEIERWWNLKIEDLSKGMAQKIQFIVTVIHEPDLLIFDEPFSGFDPVNVNLLKNEILNFSKKGTSVIFSTHNMFSVEEVCDSITLINKSKNVLSGNVEAIREQYSENNHRILFLGGSSADVAVRLNAAGFDATPKDSGESSVNEILVSVSNDRRRELLAMLNDSVDIVGFSRELPSMNDIFLKIVTS